MRTSLHCSTAKAGSALHLRNQDDAHHSSGKSTVSKTSNLMDCIIIVSISNGCLSPPRKEVQNAPCHCLKTSIIAALFGTTWASSIFIYTRLQSLYDPPLHGFVRQNKLQVERSIKEWPSRRNAPQRKCWRPSCYADAGVLQELAGPLSTTSLAQNSRSVRWHDDQHACEVESRVLQRSVCWLAGVGDDEHHCSPEVVILILACTLSNP